MRMRDLIDRQQAIDAIRNIKAIKGTSDDKILLIDKAEAQTELMMLPSTEPVRMKGKWVHCDDGSISYRCSLCGKHQYGNYSEIFSGEFYFCPNCGADMRGEEDEAD